MIRAPRPCTTSMYLVLGLSLSLLVAPSTAVAQDETYTAHTIDDLEIGLDELRLKLKPLTQAELAVEADAWMALLRRKIDETSQTNLEVREKNEAIAEAAEQVDEAEGVATTQEVERAEAKVEEHTEAKESKLDALNRLEAERVALLDRVNVVLKAWERKGGDATEHRAFISATSGPELNWYDWQALRASIVGWITSEQGGLRWGRNTGLFLLVLIVFWVLSRIVGTATSKALTVAQNASVLLKAFLVNGARRAVFLIGVVLALSMLGMPIGPFLAVIGAAGLVIGFALQGTLSNFASGILILLYRPYDVGDVINAAGVSGSVVGMNLVSTTICTFDNQNVTVPNNAIWGGVITNVTGNSTRRVDMTFGIGYADDIDRAKSVLEEIVKSHELVLPEPAPVVRLHELADSSVNFIVRPWSKTPDYWTVFWDVTRTVKQRFDAEGISIPFPQRDVHVYQESPTG